jgi:hypothetical protein
MLVVAWLCANSPQEMTLRFAAWTRDARSFSHQERLKAEVAALLSARKAEAPLLAAQPVPVRSAAAPLVVEVVLKKIDFHPALAVRLLPPEARSWRYRESPGPQPVSARAEPLVPPPRAAAS